MSGFAVTRDPRLRLSSNGRDLGAKIVRVDFASALTEPFRLIVSLTLPDRTAELHLAEGQEVTFESDDEPHIRSVRGVVVRIDERLAEHTHYEITIAPPLWLAGLRTNRRIFHKRTSVDIANEVLVDYGPAIGTVLPVLAVPPDARDYRVQTKETDLAFIERLFADDGLTHFYDHVAHQWIVTDDTTALATAAIPVPFVEGHGLERQTC